MTVRNRQWVLQRRPLGQVREDDFRLVETAPPSPGEGQVLVRVHYLSLDPYMRGRMEESRSYAAPQPLGEVMVGGTVGEVLESRSPRLAPGDTVVGMGGWQEHFVADAARLAKVDARALPESAYLGVAGMPGVTAWYGLTRVARPREGETVLVSAAAGAVGSVAGQLAKLLGCRAVGIAGGAAKCDHVVEDLGLDACVDYRSEGFRESLKEATPGGVDVVFENVGGALLDAALSRMNPFGRVALCGLVAGYQGQDIALRNVRSILVNRLRVEGFIVSDHMELWREAIGELAGHVSQGRITYRETIAPGIESAPRAFVGLLRGENLGKQLVKM